MTPMVPYLYTARDHHRVKTAEAYEAAHAAFVQRQASQGGRATVHESAVPMVARVDAGSWLVDCECGAGNAVDPEWTVACCYGCGAVHRNVAFPADVAGIETALLVRVRPADRAWRPGETVADLQAENDALSQGVRA